MMLVWNLKVYFYYSLWRIWQVFFLSEDDQLIVRTTMEISKGILPQTEWTKGQTYV